MTQAIAQLAAILTAALFIFALNYMNDPKTARHGVTAGVLGMAVAILATWAQPGIVHHVWILGAIAAGFVVGVPLSLVPLTAVPQRTALSHAFGGLAAGLVGVAEYYLWLKEPTQFTPFRTAALVIEIILGFLTFTGSLMAAGKLQEVKWVPQRPVTYPLQNVTNLALLGIAVVVGVALVLSPTAAWAPAVFPVIIVLATFIGLGVIRRVSRLLYTPLMSLTNAISAIAVVGSLVVVGEDHPLPIRILGAVALFASMTNIVSGFLITERMLKMFKKQ